jgi:hypothetical protein
VLLGVLDVEKIERDYLVYLCSHYNIALEHWRPLEGEFWTHLVECSTLDPCLLDVHALELDMCHLELECFTCGSI